MPGLGKCIHIKHFPGLENQQNFYEFYSHSCISATRIVVLSKPVHRRIHKCRKPVHLLEFENYLFIPPKWKAIRVHRQNAIVILPEKGNRAMGIWMVYVYRPIIGWFGVVLRSHTVATYSRPPTWAM